jgi:hypothetical protein
LKTSNTQAIPEYLSDQCVGTAHGGICDRVTKEIEIRRVLNTLLHLVEQISSIALVLHWYCIAILEPWYCIGIVLLEKR